MPMFSAPYSNTLFIFDGFAANYSSIVSDPTNIGDSGISVAPMGEVLSKIGGYDALFEGMVTVTEITKEQFYSLD